VRVPDPRGLERTGLSLLAYIRETAAYAAIPALIFTGMPLSDEEEESVRNLNAAVFYKPQPYSVLIRHLHHQLQTRQASTRAAN
jgi:hypothetical protein